MKKYTWLLLCVLLSACAPATQAMNGVPFDPNVAAVRSQLTSDAAESEAQIYAIMATGTAQAPIIAITQRDEFESCPKCHHPNKPGFAKCSWCKTPRP